MIPKTFFVLCLLFCVSSCAKITFFGGNALRLKSENYSLEIVMLKLQNCDFMLYYDVNNLSYFFNSPIVINSSISNEF